MNLIDPFDADACATPEGIKVRDELTIEQLQAQQLEPSPLEMLNYANEQITNQLINSHETQ